MRPRIQRPAVLIYKTGTTTLNFKHYGYKNSYMERDTRV